MMMFLAALKSAGLEPRVSNLCCFICQDSGSGFVWRGRWGRKMDAVWWLGPLTMDGVITRWANWFIWLWWLGSGGPKAHLWVLWQIRHEMQTLTHFPNDSPSTGSSWFLLLSMCPKNPMRTGSAWTTWTCFEHERTYVHKCKKNGVSASISSRSVPRKGCFSFMFVYFSLGARI